MRKLDDMELLEDHSGAWCNANELTSSFMEAISFVTPILEIFFIRTVSKAITVQTNPDLQQSCRAFMREEAIHIRAHRRFNASLLKYLHTIPPGVAMIQSLLNLAKQYLSLSHSLMLATTLEHFSAVLSKQYLVQQSQWHFLCLFTKELFAQHAREELAHRSVVFDLWFSHGKSSPIERTLIVFAVLFSGLVYVAIAIPYILYHKKGKRLKATLSALISFAIKKPANLFICSSLRELFLFADSNYHPEYLVSKRVISGIE